VLCEIDGAPISRTADAAVAATDGLIADGRLVEQAVDDHDVLKHYTSGADLIDDFAGKQRTLPEQSLPALRALGSHASYGSAAAYAAPDTANRWTRPSVEPMMQNMPADPSQRTLDELLEAAQARINRLEPTEALAALEQGAQLIDIRSDVDRNRDGIVPGSLHIPRTVLEWRLAPDSAWRNPHVGGTDQQIVLICDHGCSSVLAAATLVELGFAKAGDVIGGFAAWRDAGLPVAPAPHIQREADELAGMRPPDV
jgi:rhodanese-related sulfurtransferase